MEEQSTLTEVSVEEILALQIEAQVKHEKREARRNKLLLELGHQVIPSTLPLTSRLTTSMRKSLAKVDGCFVCPFASKLARQSAPSNYCCYDYLCSKYKYQFLLSTTPTPARTSQSVLSLAGAAGRGRLRTVATVAPCGPAMASRRGTTSSTVPSMTSRTPENSPVMRL